MRRRRRSAPVPKSRASGSTPFIRDAALNPAIETAAERRQAVATLFGARRELAGLVLLAREQAWPDAAEVRERAWRIAERIDRTIDDLAAQGIAS